VGHETTAVEGGRAALQALKHFAGGQFGFGFANRFNGLCGAAQAATQVQQKEKAGTYYAQLLQNCGGIRSDRPELAQAKTLRASGSRGL